MSIPEEVCNDSNNNNNNSSVETSSNKRRRVDYPCQYCNKSYKKPSKLAEHERSHTGERPFVCPHEGCDKAYFRSSHLAVHERSSHDSNNKKEFYCTVMEGCTASFTTRQHLHRHERIHNSPTVKCDYPGCDAEFTKRFQLRWHKAAHEKGTHPCSKCDNVFDSLPALEKHENRVHENPVLYNCSTCQQSFKKWTELRKHIQTDHPIQCSICKKVYTRQSNLKVHFKEKHTGEEAIQCDWFGCESVLQTKRSFKMHVQLVHEQNTRYKCDLCNKGFPYKSMLERHKASHTPKSSYSPRSPKKQKTLTEQLTGFNHDSEKETLACPFTNCHFKFSNEYLLKRHLEGKIHIEDVKSFELMKKVTKESMVVVKS